MLFLETNAVQAPFAIARRIRSASTPQRRPALTVDEVGHHGLALRDERK
jgi:hypothetical protein